ncbi:MAG TPA: sensor histidine kinase [Burkholderiaceae bacterium]
MRIKIVPKLPFCIGLLFGVFLLALAAMPAKQDAQLERDWDFKVHLKNVDILLRDAESRACAAPGGNNEFNDAEHWARRYDNEFRALAFLLGDNPAQKANLEEFHVLTGRLLRQFADAAGDGPRKLEAVRSGSPGEGNDVKALHALRAAMEAQQSAVIDNREDQLHERYWISVVLCFSGSLVFMALLVMFYRINLRRFAQLKRSKTELESKNGDLKTEIASRARQLAALSRHLLAVAEQEKASLARELHDELGANLTAIRLDLLVMMEKLKQKESGLAVQLSKTLQLLQRAHDIKRRIVEDLHPSMLENLGLAAAVRAYCDEVAQRSGLHVGVDMDEGPARIDAERAIAIYRIIQESLTNILKYARASRVSIRLARNAGGLLLRIVDDGIGFAESALDKFKAHGIVGMRERATLLGGSFHLGAGEHGRGTCIEVFLPNAIE